MTSSELRADARKSLTGKWGKAVLLLVTFFLINFVISFLLELIPFIGSIISAVITFPLSFGFLASYIKLKRSEEIGYTDFLTIGFSNFGKVWAVWGYTLLKLIIPLCLVVVSVIIMEVGFAGAGASAILGGSSNTVRSLSVLALIGFIAYMASLIYAVVKGYLYVLTNYILYDNPDMPAKDIVNESAILMKGHRWLFFGLIFSFIGWAILAYSLLALILPLLITSERNIVQSLIFPLMLIFLPLIPYTLFAIIAFYESLAGTKSNTEVEAEIIE